MMAYDFMNDSTEQIESEEERSHASSSSSSSFNKMVVNEM